VENQATMREAFELLNDSSTPENIQEWTQMEDKAMQNRGKSLEVYDVTLDSGKSPQPPTVHCSLLPSDFSNISSQSIEYSGEQP
jgi:hypothetical protein